MKSDLFEEVKLIEQKKNCYLPESEQKHKTWRYLREARDDESDLDIKKRISPHYL